MSSWRTKYDERTGSSWQVTDLLRRQAEEAHGDAEHREREAALKAARDQELAAVAEECWADQEKLARKIRT